MPRTAGSGLRLGLCCLFLEEPGVRFRTTTGRHLSALSGQRARQRLVELVQGNAEALGAAVAACARLGIRAFRVSSNLLPLATHANFRYEVADLPDAVLARFRRAGDEAARAGIRLSFHPDQFVVLNSPSEAVVDASLRELEVHGQLAELLGADVINLHAGGGYGNKPAALDRLARNLGRLPNAARTRLTLENDDRLYAVSDLLPLCRRKGVPLVYDVHHHRCHPDGLSVVEATGHALATWGREPLFHVSSPKGGWAGPRPRSHADYIEPTDFPPDWLPLALTVDVEAKAKERAVLELGRKLGLPDPPARPRLAVERLEPRLEQM